MGYDLLYSQKRVPDVGQCVSYYPIRYILSLFISYGHGIGPNHRCSLTTTVITRRLDGLEGRAARGPAAQLGCQ
eukprot:scaffold369082_cov35-Prasinocladus_malaysianus.AAC.1